MILLTGYTGNTGSLVLKKLLETTSSENILCLSRKKLDNNISNITNVICDLNDISALDEIFNNYPIKSIIHIANIKYSPALLKKADEYRIDKVVLVHTTGVYSKYRSYSSLYQEIEKEVMNNSYPNTNYIIVRPTMIYGNQRDHNMHKLIKFINKSPVFPVFGNGGSLMQPVHVEDLASAIIAAHQSEKISNEDFDLSGGSVVTYNEVIKTINKGLGKNKKLIYIPLKLAILGAKVLKIIMTKPFISVEQVERLQEDKAYSNEKAKVLLGYNPRTFNEGILQEIEILKEEGIIK